MEIPFAIFAVARLCRGAARCAPCPHDLKIEGLVFTPGKPRANRFAAKSVSPGKQGAAVLRPYTNEPLAR